MPRNNESGEVLCDVTATAPLTDATHTLTGGYTYNHFSTVDSVEPHRGGTGGGTTVTVKGVGFGTNVEETTVTIAGTVCPISTLEDTLIICVTESHKPSVKSHVRVQLGDKGIARQDSASFEYIDVWSSIFTWGGESLPEAGDLTVIPADMKVLLDVSTPVLKLLLIQGGQLVFDDDPKANITLRSEIILIAEGGLLQAGTENEPYVGHALIEMHGHVRSKELPIYGYKVIAVRQGTLELHGQPHKIMWTTLAKTAEAGSTEIALMSDVDWAVGSEVVIASTGDMLSQRENEKRTITAVSADGKTLTLDAPLEFKHLGESVDFNGKVLEARAEVGLLTHNVKVKGSDNVQWHDKIEACEKGFHPGEFVTQTCFQGRFGEEIGSDQYGAHILMHAPNASQSDVHIHLENIELSHMGQAFRLGRYAIHFHLNGDQSGSYIRSCSIHRSYNRAVNIHDTHNVVVENNVVYDIMGGALFTQDGVETGNVFRNNLAIFVKQSTSLQNDDITPAAIWITNANNTVVNNHAAGGTHFGFWYRMHKHPDGPSYDPDICPRNVPLGLFADNHVHSHGWFGIWIFQVFTPMEGGCCKCNVPQAAVFERLTAWNCEKGAEWVGGGALQFHDFFMVNNHIAGIEMKMMMDWKAYHYSEKHGAMIKGGVIAAKDPSGKLNKDDTKIGIILPYSVGLLVKDVTFVNFDTEGHAAFGVTNIQGTTQEYEGGYSYKMSGMKFVNSDMRAAWRWENEAVFIDEDGSLTGKANQKVVAETRNLPDDCTRDDKYSTMSIKGYVCPAAYEFHRFGFNNYHPSSLNAKMVAFTNKYGTSLNPFTAKAMTHKNGWRAILIDGMEYQMKFMDADHITNMTYSGVFYEMQKDQYIIVKHHLTQEIDGALVAGLERNSTDRMLTYNDNVHGDWYLNKNESNFYYMVSGKDTVSDDDAKNLHVHVKTYQCYYEDCIAPKPMSNVPLDLNRSDDFLYWHEPSSWHFDEEQQWFVADKQVDKRDGLEGLPKAKSDLIIENGTWVVIASEEGLQEFNKIYVYGVLEFENPPEDMTNVTAGHYKLSCTHLLLYGGRLIAGKETEPYRGDITIELRGDTSTEEVLLNTANVGAKAIGVFGVLDLHGMPRTTWTKLQAKAETGTNQLSLLNPVNWMVGDEIVIAPTGYDMYRAEVRKITAIEGGTITVDENLEFDHEATDEDVGNEKIVELRAEVGVLTHNIRVIGQESKSSNFDAKLDIPPGLEKKDDIPPGLEKKDDIPPGLEKKDDIPPGLEKKEDNYIHELDDLEKKSSKSDKLDISFGDSSSITFGTHTGFGGRIIVGYAISNQQENYGYARISNVEFRNMGQMGYEDDYDPRFAIAFTKLGLQDRENPVYVRNCSFVDSYNTAIGTFGTHGASIENNLIFKTQGPALKIWDNKHLIRNNLVVLMQYMGTFAGRQEHRENWYAAIEVNFAFDIIMEGNVVAGSERSGYRIDGEPCGTESMWQNNVAHSTLLGVIMMDDLKDGLLPCSLINGFVTWRNIYWGMWLETGASLEIFDHTSIDDTVGLYPLVIGPSSTAHDYDERTVTVTNSSYVGTSSSFACEEEQGFLDALQSEKDDHYSRLMKFAGMVVSFRAGETGRSGLTMATFSSGPSGAPSHPFNGIMSYQTIYGRTNVTGVIFKNYGKTCDYRTYAVTPPAGNDDAIHPMYMFETTKIDVDYESLTFYFRPNLGKINPSDCVDMECDGLKKAIIQDFDGSFLDLPGFVIPQSEWEWDGDPKRGLGDYRIPKTLLTDGKGNRIDVKSIAPMKGILRDPTCKLVESFQAYVCSEWDYQMLHLESMDTDTETRRISPVAVLGQDDDNVGYVDLVNGPQDHGWCMGYTCQKRLSLFPIVLAMDRAYEIHFTGTPPQKLRLHLLNTDDTQAVRLALYFARSQNIEVFHDGQKICQKNEQHNALGQLEFTEPSYPDEFMPDLASDVSGKAFFEPEFTFFHVLVRGSKPVELWTKKTVFVSFNVPVMSVDEFFGEKIVANLASFLGIDPKKIKIATGVRESRKRKKREESTIRVKIEIVNPPSASITSANPDDLSAEQFDEIASKITTAYQLGELDGALDVQVLDMELVAPPPDADSPEWQIYAELDLSGPVRIQIPADLRITIKPSTKAMEGETLDVQPALQLFTGSNEVVTQVGTLLNPWEITCYLKRVSGFSTLELLGNTTVKFLNGWFNFTDLGVLNPGTYKLEFVVTEPESVSHFRATSEQITIKAEKSDAAPAPSSGSKQAWQPPPQEPYVLVPHDAVPINKKRPTTTIAPLNLGVPGPKEEPFVVQPAAPVENRVTPPKPGGQAAVAEKTTSRTTETRSKDEGLPCEVVELRRTTYHKEYEGFYILTASDCNGKVVYGKEGNVTSYLFYLDSADWKGWLVSSGKCVEKGVMGVPTLVNLPQNAPASWYEQEDPNSPWIVASIQLSCFNPCDDKPCANGGSCSQDGAKIKCDCVQPYYGLYCEKEKINLMESAEDETANATTQKTTKKSGGPLLLQAKDEEEATGGGAAFTAFFGRDKILATCLTIFIVWTLH